MKDIFAQQWTKEGSREIKQRIIVRGMSWGGIEYWMSTLQPMTNNHIVHKKKYNYNNKN